MLLELEWIKLGRRRMTPGRPVTFVVTQIFLDHFGMESSKDLPGIKELRDAGLLDNRPPPGAIPGVVSEETDADGDDDQDDRPNRAASARGMAMQQFCMPLNPTIFLKHKNCTQHHQFASPPERLSGILCIPCR